MREFSNIKQLFDFNFAARVCTRFMLLVRLAIVNATAFEISLSLAAASFQSQQIPLANYRSSVALVFGRPRNGFIAASITVFILSMKSVGFQAGGGFVSS